MVCSQNQSFGSKTFDFPIYKIGITETDVSSRIDQLQTGNPNKLKILFQ